jgi:hypothetical protein
MPGTVTSKLGVEAGARTIVVGLPVAARDLLDLPSLDLAADLKGDFDCIHVFAKTAAELDQALPRLKAHLGPSGMLWVSWPKGGQLSTDLALPKVIDIGYRHGLVESKCVSVDATWSALKFTHPKPGKTYRNSYGRLPGG